MREHVSLATYTTLKTGGDARYFATVTNEAELEAAVQFAEQTALPLLCIGGGSNLLVPDAGWPGVVVHMAIMGRAYTAPDAAGQVMLTVGAGEVFDEVVAETCARGLWGLENLSAIPGTVGATPIQNVGAYGVEMSDLITSVTVFDTATHTVRELSAADCHFSYRDSLFKSAAGTHLIVLRVMLRLTTQATPRLTYADIAARLPSGGTYTPAQVRHEVMAIRSAKFPDWRVVGTAGSFFKNPIIATTLASELKQRYPDLPVYPQSETTSKVSLGYILDKVCGLKGFAIGPVRLYEAQALVLVATPPATTADILAFATEVTKRVYDATGITIEHEVTMPTIQK